MDVQLNSNLQSDLESQVRKNAVLDKYREGLKHTLNDRINVDLRSVYEEMMPLSTHVPEGALSRFLLRIRQNRDGYIIKKGYVNFGLSSPINTNDAVLTFSIGPIWNPILSHRKIETKPWETSFVLGMDSLMEKRKIVRLFLPTIKETVDFVSECWNSLLLHGDDLDKYHQIAANKFTMVNLKVGKGQATVSV